MAQRLRLIGVTAVKTIDCSRNAMIAFGPSGGTREKGVVRAMNETVTIALIVLVAVLVSLVGLALVRRLAPRDQLAQHTEVAGYVYAVIGVIYAVVLALVVIAAWEEYRDARAAVADEASAVLNLARAANGWPAGDRAAVESALVAYARQVVGIDWPAMARGDFGPASDSVTVNQLWQALNDADASAAAKSASYEVALLVLMIDATKVRRSTCPACAGRHWLTDGSSAPGLFSSTCSSTSGPGCDGASGAAFRGDPALPAVSCCGQAQTRPRPAAPPS
jgi:hypothetical protein